MKENKSKKWLWILLGIAGLLLVGTVGYLSGRLSSIEKEHSSVESSKVISSSKRSSSSNRSTKSKQEVYSESKEGSSNITSSAVPTGSNSVSEANGHTGADVANGTFDGCHNVHELANKNETVVSVLIKYFGYTPEQAYQYVNENMDWLMSHNMLGSGTIQTAYQYSKTGTIK